MSRNIFPAFTNMIPTVEDIQLIVDSLRQEDRYRTTKDGIFTPGIVNKKDSYLSIGTKSNSLKIKPFIAYTPNGDRIEVSDTFDNLYAQGSVINVTAENLVSQYENIPVWYPFTNTFEIFNSTENLTEYKLELTKLGRGSILHGIKLRANAPFTADSEPNVYVSIGTESEPEKFLPPTLISENNTSTDISVMNLMYSFDDSNTTGIFLTFTTDSGYLNNLSNGSLTTNVCIANLSSFDNSDLNNVPGGYPLSSSSINTWQPSTTYHIVARYTEIEDNFRELNYTTIDGTNISTNPEPTRYISSYQFFALRKTGTIIDQTTLNDVKLGEVFTDPNGDIYSIQINTKNSNGDDCTQYLTIPGYRFVDGINADQIGNGDVTNEQFSYLNTLTGNVQSQLSSKASLTSDNTFTGINTFAEQIVGSIDKVNGFTATATPSANSLLVLDENGKIPADALSESTVASIGNIYTISSGVTTNGRADFLAPNDSKTAIVVKASSEYPLVLNYPDGSAEKFTENQEISGISADGYYYLIKEKGGNFVFLPTSGGTRACIPVVDSSNTFYLDDVPGGIVESYYDNSSTYQAFDGTISTGVKLGQVYYKNYYSQVETSYLPNGVPTYITVHFPTAITPTSFAVCFRKNQYDATPKQWSFEATNDDYDSASATWIPITSSQNSTWNQNEIKSIGVDTNNVAYKNFRIIFDLNDNTINNYLVGEETSAVGVTMPINCYYFQIYANNTDTSIKGQVVEDYIKPLNMSMGSYFLDISKKPYTGYKCIGNNLFSPINYVKLGLVEVIDYNVTENRKINCYPFCYNTFTISNIDIPDQDPSDPHIVTYPIWVINSGEKLYTNKIAKNTPITFEHNLGLIPNIIKIKFRCIEENNGYSVDDYITDIYFAEDIEDPQTSEVIGRNLTSICSTYDLTMTTLKLWPGVNSNTLYVRNKITGSFGSVSNNQWAIVIYCSRGW